MPLRPVLAIGILVVSQISASGDKKSEVEFITAKMEASYQAVKTFSGEYSLMEKFRSPLEAHQNAILERVVSARFARDLQNDSLYSRYETIGPDVINGKQLGNPGFLFETVADRYSGFICDRAAGATGVTRKLTRDGIDHYTEASYVIDPRRFWGFNGDQRLFESFERMVLMPKTYDLTNDGQDRVALTLRMQSVIGLEDSLATARYVIDKTVGFNFVHYLCEEAGVKLFEQRVKYANYSGVFVPSYYYYASYSNEGELETEREFKLLSAKVNEPLPKDHGTLASLDLQKDDRVDDKTAKKRFIVRDKKLVETDRYYQPPRPAVPPDNRSALRVALMIAPVILFGCIAWRARKDRKDTTPPE